MSEAISTEVEATEQPAAAETTEQASTEVTPDQALIAENQKYRKRAQDAEAKLKQHDKDAEAFTLKRLKDEGKLKEANELLTESVKTLETENADFKEKFQVIADVETKERETLIAALPEDKRDLYEGVSLPNLRTLVADATGAETPGANSARPGRSSLNVPDKPYNELTKEEKKRWHAQFDS